VRNLLALAYLVLGGYWAYALHTRLFRAYGKTRLGRFVAYVPAALCFGLGVGVMGALWDGGWHRVRGPGYYYNSRTTLEEGLVIGLVLGLIAGGMFFLQSERKGGQLFLDDGPAMPEFPPEYVQEVLAAEPRASTREKANTARFLQKRSRKTGQPLPPELVAFVERNTASRGLTGR
jgi:hypothetical protein